MTVVMKSPFPWFGGKSRVAAIVWDALGDVKNYVEPFFGSGAVLLARPNPTGIETVNDADGLLANFWRALQHDPDAVATHADNPVNECDLHARHLWLVDRRESITDRLCGDPDWFDPKAAGWWVWGQSCWIAGGWCSGEGPWQSVDGVMVDSRKLPHLSNAGQGVKRQRPHLSTAGQGVNRQRPHLSDAGQGVNRKLPHLSNAGRMQDRRDNLIRMMREFRDRLRDVRVACGDWSRVIGPSVTTTHGLTGVFLDPPYSGDCGRDNTLYSVENTTVSADVRKWAIERGSDPLVRIVLCGYDGEHSMPDDWRVVAWKTHGGYGSMGDKAGRENKHRERLWLSPHCEGGK